MNNSEIVEHLLKVKCITGDNDVRYFYDKTPCCVSFYSWTPDEIDNLPKDFDWKKFWKDCKTYYPLHSVAGSPCYNTPEKIIDEEEYNVPIDWLRKKLKTKSDKRTVLEIGYGFGGASKAFEKNGFIYTGIDYVSSNEENKNDDRFLEISENGIPQKLYVKNKFDIVYSVNVFQHLTKQQRMKYYRQSYDVLKKGGLFYFDLFCKNEEFFRNNYKPEEEKKLAYATNFFGVHTYVPYETEVIQTLKDIGYTIVKSESINLTKMDVRTNSLKVTAKK